METIVSSPMKPTRTPEDFARPAALDREPPTATPPASSERDFAGWMDGVRRLAPASLTRLTGLVSQLLGGRLRSLRPDERQTLLFEVIGRVVSHLSELPISGPKQLLDRIEREASALGLPQAPPVRTRTSWLDRLASMLPELEGIERRVLEGLYLEARDPAILAERLGLSALELHEARQRGLSALRSRLVLAES